MRKKYKSDYFGTRIFYKLDRPIILSKKLGISLINYNVNRTGYGFFKVTEDVGFYDSDKYNDDYEVVKKCYRKNKKRVEDISKELFNKKITAKNLETYNAYREYILSTILIVKFDKQYEERITYEHKKIVLPDEKKENEIINYIHFLNFLTPYNELFEQRNYPSKDFMVIMDDIPALFLQTFAVIDDNRKKTKLKPFKYISKTFANIVNNIDNPSYHLKEFRKNNSLNVFRLNLDMILEVTQKMEELFEDNLFVEIFKYIANAIYVADNSYDDRTSILIYSSVIESLLTHKPDYNRFNVEDSISKQFALKTCIILEKECKDYDIEKYCERCKLFYSIRSDIAHGNVENYSKAIKQFDKLYTKSEDFKDIETTYDDVLENVRLELKNILYHVLKLYLKDKKYVDFIKNN